jgi:hypothetical protein
MAGDATTLPLPGRARRAHEQYGSGAWSGTAAERAVAIASLAAILVLSLLVVLMAANRPSLLSPATHSNFYPRWMAGPLGGLWPGLTGNGTTLKYLFSGAIVLMYAGYLGVLRSTARIPAAWVIGAIVAVHAIFILSPPLALTDLFNYINYGRMEVVHHLNPYTSIPILEPHDDPSYALSNWHQLLSPYGPLFTILTFAVVPLGVAASFWVLKVLLAAASLGTIALVWRCAQLLGRDPLKAIVLVGLNPIVLVWGLGGDHNDFLMVFCIVLGFYLLLLARDKQRPAQAGGLVDGRLHEGGLPADDPRAGGLRRWLTPLSPHLIGAGAAFIVAAGIKASAGVLVPVLLAGIARHRRALTQVLIGMLIASLLVGLASLIAFGLHIPDLSTQSRLVTSESVPNLIGLAIGAGGESEPLHHVMSAVLVLSIVACCVAAWRARPGDRGPGSSSVSAERAIAACGWASVALLVTLSWVLPWYVLWVLPLTALSASRRLRTGSLLLGAYLIIAWAPASGQLWNAIGFHPEKTSLGRLHQRYVRELLH